MAEKTPRQGQCMCGSVRILARSAGNEVGACHCSMCRQWGGGPFMEINCGSEVEFEGEEHIRTFASSAWAQRGFCQQCGTHLFYRLVDSGVTMVPVGLFDSDENLVFKHQVFIDEKPAFYSFSNRTRNLTGAEAVAKFKTSD